MRKDNTNTLEKVLNAACKVFDVNTDSVKGRSHTQAFAAVRFVYTALTKELGCNMAEAMRFINRSSSYQRNSEEGYTVVEHIYRGKVDECRKLVGLPPLPIEEPKKEQSIEEMSHAQYMEKQLKGICRFLLKTPKSYLPFCHFNPHERKRMVLACKSAMEWGLSS